MNPSPFPFYIGFSQVVKKLSLYKKLGALVMELMYLGIGGLLGGGEGEGGVLFLLSSFSECVPIMLPSSSPCVP